MNLRKNFLIGAFLGLILLLAAIVSLPDGRLHLVFCDVGQGDAAYIKMPDNQDVLIDGGPDNKVLSCLGRHMPFYDRTIDVVILTHPQEDHLKGLVSVLERYNVKYFVSSPVGNQTEGYQKLKKIVEERGVLVKNIYAGQEVDFSQVKMLALWPEKDWLAARIEPGEANTSSSVLGAKTSQTDLNDFSLVFNLEYGSFQGLLMGDAGQKTQEEILRLPFLAAISQATILKVPHHGSKTSLLPEFLEKIKPKLAIISVGKNSYGHPSPQTLEKLNHFVSQILQTDQKGDIEVVSDGQALPLVKF